MTATETVEVAPIHKKVTSADLTRDLATLQQELDRVTALAGKVDALQRRVASCTSGHLLGSVSLPDLQRAQSDYEEAVNALGQKSILQSAVAEAKRNLEYTIAQEKQEFVANIHKQFQQARERYTIESRKLLELFRELHRLHLQSLSMRSHELLTARDYRLDLPSIRNPNDSEAFTVGQMLRDGAY